MLSYQSSNHGCICVQIFAPYYIMIIILYIVVYTLYCTPVESTILYMLKLLVLCFGTEKS